MIVHRVAPAPVEAHAHGDPVAIHDVEVVVPLPGIPLEADSEVGVHVHHGEPRPLDDVPLDPQPRLGPEEP